MKHFFKKLTALVIAVMMFLPSSVFASGAGGTNHKDTSELDYTIADAIFDEVYAVAQEESALRSADDQIQRIYDYLQSAEGVKDGSVSMNGDGCVFWQTENGITCSYSTLLQEIMASAKEPAEEDNAPDVQIKSYATRGTSHGSDVYLFQPYFGMDGSFTRQYQTEAERITEAADGTYHYYKAGAATVDAIADAIEDGGVIIFDSHGSTDYDDGKDDYTSKATTSYLCLQSGEGLTDEDYKDGHAVYGGGSGQMKYYQVDGTVIANHMDRSANNGLLWMAICLGMATDGLEAPMMEKGMGAVYGYSQSVTFVGDYTFEEAFFDSLLAGNDVATAISDMKERCGKWDYSSQIVAANSMPSSYTAESYEDALQKKAAFPIVVSAEDEYPGHGKVDAEQTVYSTWALTNKYNLTAQADTDNDKNTIETRGATITAKPTDGYYASGYTITPENAATVKQDGNVFRVSAMREDCTVTIHFAAKTDATVHFIVPDGVTQADMNSYVGDPVVLPMPQGTPESTSQEYHFVGWTETPVDTPVEAADYIKAGESYTLSGEDVTFYALYQYFATPEGTTPHFYEVESEPEDWSGTYVITGGERALLCDGSQMGLEMGNAAAALPLESTGMSVSESGELSGVSGAYTVQIAAIPGTEDSPKYAIRLGGTNQAVYLACRSNNDQLNTSADLGTTLARWTITWENGHIVCKNVRYPGRTLQFCTDGQYFRCVTKTRTDAAPLTAYRGDDSSLWYTTNLSAEAPETVATPVIAPNGGSFKGSQTVEITCGTAGSKIYYTTDGTTPTASSKLYSGSFTLTDSATVKAIAVKDGMTDSLTATASFTKQNDGGEPVFTTYAINVAPCENGAVSVNFKYAGRGDVVTITVAPDNGYQLDKLSVAGSDGKALPLTDKGDGKYTFSMPGDKVTVTAEFKAEIIEPENPFKDVSDDAYYKDAVLWAVSEGITTGTAATVFSPNDDCTRAQAVTFLWRAAGSPKAFGSNPFRDVSADAYYYDAVLWAVKNGITLGTSDKTFDPDATVTRAQAVTFLHRAAGSPKASGSVFSDVSDAAYYADAVAWAVQKDITNGTGSGRFSPDDDCTRAQIVTLLYRQSRI